MQGMLYSFAGSLLVTLLLTPLVCRIAQLCGLVDLPGARKIHAGPVPRLGGLAIVVGAIAGLAIAALTGAIPTDAAKTLIAVAATSSLIFLVGLADDLWNLPSKLKLSALLLASIIICASGLRIDHLTLLGFSSVHLGILAWPVSILWIVGISVAMNFIDGLDGLAGGIAAITAAACAVVAISSGNVVAAVFALALFGSSCGFLFFNFHPARIFMGDSGSMFLGFAIAVCALTLQSKGNPGALLVPAMALSVPLLDLIFTMLRRRVLQRRSLFAAERGHIHHRLLDAGLSQRQSALLLYGVTAAAASGGILALAGRYWALLSISLVTSLVIAFFHRTGAARMGDTFSAFRKNRARTRDLNGHRRSFEDLQLRLAMVRSFDSWWSETCAAAETLGFATLSLESSNRDATLRVDTWSSSSPKSGTLFYLSFPVVQQPDEPPAKMSLTAETAGVALESISHRIALFTRLMDEFPIVGPSHTMSLEIRPRFEHLVDLHHREEDLVDTAAYVGA